MESYSPTSAGFMAQPEGHGEVSYEQLLKIIAFQSNEIMNLKKEINDLRAENSQLKQINDNGTALDTPDLQSGSMNAGRRKKEIDTNRFRDALKDGFKAKADQIIDWIKGKIAQLNTEKNYCSALTGNSRLMAPMYVTIQAGVYTPKNTNDTRPVMEGSPLERFFGLPAGSYSKYSKFNSYRPGEIQALTDSFQKDVLNSAK